MEGPVAEIRAALLAATAEGADVSAEAKARLSAGWPNVIALCSIDAAVRAELGDLRERVTALGDDHEWAYWIGLILGVLHAEPFVAIEPSSRTGLVGRMSGVVDNFQLHTLLMDAFPTPRGRLGRRARRVSASAAAVARGDGPQQADETIIGAWNLYTYAALRDGHLPQADNPAVELWIWNEGTPSDIPTLGDHRVILLGEPTYKRSWQAQRTFPQPTAALDVEAVESNALDDWLTAIRAAAD